MSKVLIVEDEGITAMTLRIMLEEMGHMVVGIAPKGKVALEIIEKHHPDVVLMDIVLQNDLRGIDTTRIINERHGTKVIYMTSHTDEGTLEEARQTEHKGFLFKPFGQEQLEEALAAVA